MRVLLLFCLLGLVACQSLQAPSALPAWQSPQAREHAQLGHIIELRTGRLLTPAQLLEALASTPLLLVGEQHDNPDHHALQLWLLRNLVQRRAQGSLLLEMLDSSQQQALRQGQDDSRRGARPADPLLALHWQAGWPWHLYGPLVEYALRQPYPLLAANLSRSELLQVYRQPPQLVGTASSAAAVRQALLAQIRESHCQLLPESQLPAMLAVQQQRDRRMAEALLAAAQPAMLLAGAYHVRRDVGVPLHLADLGGPAARVLILAEAGREVTAEQADYVWYSAAVEEQDYCASLRQR